MVMLASYFVNQAGSGGEEKPVFLQGLPPLELQAPHAKAPGQCHLKRPFLSLYIYTHICVSVKERKGAMALQACTCDQDDSKAVP